MKDKTFLNKIKEFKIVERLTRYLFFKQKSQVINHKS